ncbi:MAG: hypothetical protein ACR2O7_03105 [Parasphingorhabdus sp.]
MVRQPNKYVGPSLPTISPNEPAADIPSSVTAAGSDHYGLNACVPEKGIVILYHTGQPSQCPGCGGANWNIGRITAECARCTFAIDLVQSGR